MVGIAPCQICVHAKRAGLVMIAATLYVPRNAIITGNALSQMCASARNGQVYGPMVALVAGAHYFVTRKETHRKLDGLVLTVPPQSAHKQDSGSP